VRRGGASAKVLGGLVSLFVLLALFWHPATPPVPAPAAAAAVGAVDRPPPPPLSDSAHAVELLAEAKTSCTNPSAARLRRLIHDYGLIWQDEALVRVTCRQVVIGMTAAQVRAAWGAPDQINTTETLASASEQWVYPGARYVYLDAGRMTAVQTSR